MLFITKYRGQDVKHTLDPYAFWCLHIAFFPFVTKLLFKEVFLIQMCIAVALFIVLDEMGTVSSLVMLS